LEKKNNLGEEIYKFLKSTRLTVWIFTMGLILFILGMIFPQETFAPEAVKAFVKKNPLIYRFTDFLGWHHIFYTWYFYLLTAAFSLNLTLCTYERFKKKRRISLIPPKGLTKRVDFKVPLSLNEAGEFLQNVLKGLKFEVRTSHREDGIYILGRKNTSGIWGSYLFHLSLLIIVVGWVFSGLTTFEGEFLAAEGIEAKDAPSSYLVVTKKPVLTREFDDFVLKLGKIRVDYEKNTLTDISIPVKVYEGGVEVAEKVVKVNYPLNYRGKNFVLKKIGFTPFIEVREDSQVLFSFFLNLAERTEKGFRDKIKVANGISMEVEALPDYPAEKVNPKLKYKMGKPYLHLTFKRGSEKIGEGDVLIGSSSKIGGYEVSFPEMRMWALFFVRRDLGLPLIYLGLAGVLFGLLIRFLMVEKTVKVFLKEVDGKVGISWKWRALFSNAFVAREEVKALQKLKEESLI
jgi:cytochrome c biogenesis protein